MHTMEKVLVIGSPGSGKSTFSRRLREITGLPLFYLDLLWHRVDKTTCSREEFDRELGEILKREEWILDGNYARTLPLRLAACDTVFWLDYPPEVCLEGIRERRGKPREDMPWIEMEEDEEFMEYVRSFPAVRRQEIQRHLEEHPEKKIVVFHSRGESETFLASLK